MRVLNIREPIWKDRSVGIDDKIITEDITVNITYRDKSGKRLYPNPFLVEKAVAKKCPFQDRKGFRLRLVPISEMAEIPCG